MIEINFLMTHYETLDTHYRVMNGMGEKNIEYQASRIQHRFDEKSLILLKSVFSFLKKLHHFIILLIDSDMPR